ncbi:MAG TPA: fumarylacetoacetate hydrolase family protein [Mycobacteriales bacterium]|nr:fumarylacetoacetate hydrolase family protein [Mycobacteriales bacterium]
MRLGRVCRDGEVFLARLEKGDTVVPLMREPVGPGRDVLREALAAGTDLTAEPVVELPEASPLSGWHLLSPVIAPQKVIAIGLNYADHARESGLEPPSAPVMFLKTTNSIIGPNAPIVVDPTLSAQVDYEVELAIVIGRRARNVPISDALNHVLGYTLCNDVSARDAQFADGQWSRAKSFDTFCPLGPWIVTTDEFVDVQNLGIRTRLNGVTVQDSTTREMIFGVAELVSYLSRFLTLEFGDVIATGTPPGVGFARTPPLFLTDGDVVEIEVDGIGVLRNPVTGR